MCEEWVSGDSRARLLHRQGRRRNRRAGRGAWALRAGNDGAAGVARLCHRVLRFLSRSRGVADRRNPRWLDACERHADAWEHALLLRGVQEGGQPDECCFCAGLGREGALAAQDVQGGCFAQGLAQKGRTGRAGGTSRLQWQRSCDEARRVGFSVDEARQRGREDELEIRKRRWQVAHKKRCGFDREVKTSKECERPFLS
mmetsp:Transcript_2301/g.9896  ORF Transcript_2301/g.9896 Transcript_2301/m.9896 type:complete len:200 (+) Transcript_2301:162-761(+)